MQTMKDLTTEKDLLEGPFLFIVNPSSGVGAYKQFYRAFKKNKPFTHTVIESHSKEHMISLAFNAQKEGYTACIAVGGDGTVHGIACELIHKNIALGIIPTGSGNGIARHLGISMNIQTALSQILHSSIKKIDALFVNNHKAIGFCGIGFDAFVAKLIDEAPGRGFANYVGMTTRALQNYIPKPIEIDGESTSCFSSIISNVSQLGNNARINPNAQDDDSLFELINIEKPALAETPLMIAKLFNGTFHLSKYVNIVKHQAVTIKNEEGLNLQIDGEPMGTPKKINIRVNPQSLNVLTP